MDLEFWQHCWHSSAITSFFFAPYFTLTVHETQDIIALLIFLVVAVLISQLVGRVKKNLEASLEREAEANRLYELSIGLAGVNDWKEIAVIVAQKIQETFQTDICERVSREPAW